MVEITGPAAFGSSRKPSHVMKPTCFRAMLLAAVAFLPLQASAAPGDLDLTFEPEVEPDTFGWIRPAGRQVYLYNYSARPVRLRDDGSLDDWTLAAPANSQMSVFGLLPWGGTYVSSDARLYFDSPEGGFTSLSTVTMTPRALHPLDDGSFIVSGSGGRRVSRYRPDFTLDAAFAERSALVSASSPDGSVMNTALDSAGRLILAGAFSAVGGIERLGLARLLPDGSVDPSWNPALDLGVTLTAQGMLTGVPTQIAIGGDDAVYLRASFEDESNLQTYRVLRISADGTVTGNFPADGYGYAAPVVQPDGKIIIIGSFGTWQGEPTPGIVRLNTDGSRDASFAPQLGFPGNVSMGDAALDDRGRLLITGRFDSVNGVPRPGVARLFAFDPVETEPSLSISTSRPRIGTNEVLRLTAQVTGTPLPDLQWYRNGEPIPGATHRGLALPVTGGDSIGSFQLVASNALGTTTVDFPPVTLARRSPRPGATEAEFDVVLTGFGEVRAMVAQEDGRILVGSGSLPADPLVNVPLVGRLLPDGSWDESFGSNGIVTGRGIVASLRVLADGHILIAGHLLRVAGAEVSGLAELDCDGSLVPRAFPILDVPHTTAALKLPEGGYVVAGRFRAVGEQAAFRMARLRADLSVETEFSSPLEYWQLVDDLAHDSQGRLLIAGSQTHLDPDQPGPISNPAPVGVRRLKSDGSPDPEFQHDPAHAHRLRAEPDGTVLVGTPPRRLDDRGQLATEFEPVSGVTTGIVNFISPTIRPRTVLTRNGGVVYLYRRTPSISTPWGLYRWTADGTHDLDFEATLAAGTPIPFAVVATELPDRSLLIAASSSGDSRLLRIPPDSDLRLENPRLVDGDLRADLRTQPGRNYVVRQRATLNGPAGEPVAELTGDGYLQEVQAEAAGNTGFLELLRE